MYKTIEHFVGNTPLVRLKHLPGHTTNVILAKLEGNNPAGSVKDRPALSMIVQAEAACDRYRQNLERRHGSDTSYGRRRARLALMELTLERLKLKVFVPPMF